MNNIIGKIIEGVKANKFVKLDEEATQIKNIETGVVVKFLPTVTEVILPNSEEKITLNTMDRFLLEKKLNRLAKKKAQTEREELLKNI